jgi:hypothetical protein
MATPECGPSDGPALSVYFTKEAWAFFFPPTPYARVVLWSSPGDLVGRTWTWYGSSAMGSSAWCDGRPRCLEGTATRITFGPFAADSSLDVDVDLTFEGGTRLRGTAHARWRTRQLNCG